MSSSRCRASASKNFDLRPIFSAVTVGPCVGRELMPEPLCQALGGFVRAGAGRNPRKKIQGRNQMTLAGFAVGDFERFGSQRFIQRQAAGAEFALQLAELFADLGIGFGVDGNFIPQQHG